MTAERDPSEQKLLDLTNRIVNKLIQIELLKMELSLMDESKIKEVQYPEGEWTLGSVVTEPYNGKSLVFSMSIKVRLQDEL